MIMNTKKNTIPIVGFLSSLMKQNNPKLKRHKPSKQIEHS